VVIVNQAMADMVFPNQDPIGKRINFTYTNEPNYVQIVGVVGNENVDSLDAPPTPIVYDCYEQDPYPYFSLVIRTKKDPSSLVGAVTRAINDLEPQAPVFKVSSMSQIISTSPAMLVRAYPAYLIGGFSALALLLATLGLYGVLAYSVAERSRELGLRMALGAQRGDVLKMVVASGLKLALAGIACGVVGGLVTARLIASLLFGVAPTDAATFAGVCAVLTTVGQGVLGHRTTNPYAHLALGWAARFLGQSNRHVDRDHLSTKRHDLGKILAQLGCQPTAAIPQDGDPSGRAAIDAGDHDRLIHAWPRRASRRQCP